MVAQAVAPPEGGRATKDRREQRLPRDRDSREARARPSRALASPFVVMRAAVRGTGHLSGDRTGGGLSPVAGPLSPRQLRGRTPRAAVLTPSVRTATA